ncbi:MAG TPA: class I SAM-dependent methyltransferase, partial [Solirubrobacteraceae bacterium]|nr:class I SAM-dependent methyltransferase [Solirubrobacteraceae bacterium]
MTARVARRLVMALLKRIRVGQLTVIEDGRETVFGSGAPQATVHVHSPRAWPQLARGSRGMGGSYAEALWDTPDLTAVIRVAARNVQHIDAVRHRLTFIRAPFQRARAAFMRNTPRRSRKDIAAHYDLGNELFALMLDPTLMYSCGVFEHRDATLEEASI